MAKKKKPGANALINSTFCVLQVQRLQHQLSSLRHTQQVDADRLRSESVRLQEKLESVTRRHEEQELELQHCRVRTERLSQDLTLSQHLQQQLEDQVRLQIFYYNI